uniref:Neurotransmitter-gated ion-channel transmembrane domain-containing protein n=1 Tax=Kryptolebias marmoratus TaxID=37003 RepID=A0A3Q3ADG3_KRYMA
MNLTSSNSLLEIMRPVKNWTDPTLVKVDMVLYGILGLVSVLFYWMNDFLTWNSSDFCGIDELFLPRSMLWIPDIIIKQEIHKGEEKYCPGVIKSLKGFILVHCLFFPFDVQQCNITFLSMEPCSVLHTVRSLVLGSARNDSTLLKLSEQRPFLYVINFIIPMVYLLVLDLGAFFLSESGGDKLSFKVTLLLSISVLLLILKDILPSTEVCLPLIGEQPQKLIFIMFNLVFLSLSADEEYGHVKPEEAPRRDADLLRTILDEVKSAQQKTESQKKQKMKPGFCRKLAKIVDILFFLLYFLAVLMLMTYICMAWVEF